MGRRLRRSIFTVLLISTAAMAPARSADPAKKTAPAKLTESSVPAAPAVSSVPPKPASMEHPPKPVEVSAPAGVTIRNEIPMITVRLSDIVRGPVPKRLEGAVAWIRPYRTFRPTTDAGLITLEITADGPVYLAATWLDDGRLEEAKKPQIRQDEDLASQGWMAVGSVEIIHRNRNATETNTVYVRYCRAGEKFTIRTRAYVPPAVLKVPDDRLAPSSIAALEPDEGIPEELRRSFTGAKALNLAVEHRYHELERWAGGLLTSGAMFPSGHYQIRSVARAFSFSGSLLRPEDYERRLPDMNGWLEAYPQSNAARLTLASVLIDYAKALRLRNRGIERRADVDEARRRALELLYEVEQSDPKLPHMYLEYMLLAREERWDEDLATEYFRRAVASGAWCPQAVTEFIAYLDSLEQPDPEAFREKVRAHVESAVTATRATHGDRMYAASIKDIEYYRPDHPLRVLGYDWPRLRASFDELITAGPASRRTLTAYCRLAAAANDKPTAERLFAELGPFRREDSEAWTSEAEYSLNRVWTDREFASGDQRALFDLSASGAVGLAWTDDGPRYLDRRGLLISLDPQSGAQEVIHTGIKNVHLSLAMTQDGGVAVGSGFWGKLGIRRPDPTKSLSYSVANRPTIACVAIARDGKSVVFIRETGEGSILDLAADYPRITPERTFRIGKSFPPHVEFTPDGSRLVIHVETEVMVWNVESLKQEFAWKTGDRRGTTAALSPDGNILATTDGKSVRFWAFADGTPLGMVEIPERTSRAMRFSTDGRRLAVGEGNFEQLAPSAVHVIDVERFQLVKTFVGHKCAVTGVAFSPDGRTLLSVSFDRSARVWDLPD